ncbi:MAG: glycosyltransferase family 4 protein [bacterium]
MNPLTVFMIIHDDFPPEPRVEREVEALHSHGLSLHILAGNTRGDPLLERLPHIAVHRLAMPPRPLRRFAKLCSLPFFLNPRWIFAALRLILKLRPDVLHVHDLPLAPIGIFFARLFRKKLVLDLHENYPALLKTIYRGTLFEFLFKNPSLAALLERLCVRLADRILVVVPEQLPRLQKMGADPLRIHVVGNGEPLDPHIAQFRLDALLAGAADSLDIAYVGRFEPSRGLHLLIRAFAALSREFPDARLFLVGAGPAEPALKSLAFSLGANDRIVFTGWLPFGEMYDVIERSCVGVVPHEDSELFHTTLPHKLFQYMALGKPVVATDTAALRRVVAGENCGLVVPYGDTDAMSGAFRTLLSDGALRRRLGANGIRAVAEKYSWQHDSAELINAYRQEFPAIR